MTLEEFKEIDCSSIPISNLIAMIARGQSIYLNHRLGDLGINETQLHLLFEISHNENLNQERIATRCNINKGAVARSIKKLEDKGFVERTIDENNRRQNKVSLTLKGRKTLSEAIKIVLSHGKCPYVFQSQNVDGFDNNAIYEHFKNRIKHF